MNWQEVCEHPDLQNLPFKIELNEWGKIIMSPVKVYHSLFQGKILRLLNLMLPHGETLVECAITTRKGTKVADVAWASVGRVQVIKDETECSIAPEICVEVLSSGNTEEEIDEKRTLYFETGAQEVWVCDEDGNLCFSNAAGALETSAFAPQFPQKISI